MICFYDLLFFVFFFFLMIRRPPRSTLFPTRRSSDLFPGKGDKSPSQGDGSRESDEDRKSTRLNSSHANISYAVFCLKKKKKKKKKMLITKKKKKKKKNNYKQIKTT